MAGERQNLHLAGGQDPIWRLWSQLPGPWRGPVIGDDVEGWESITENDDYRINLTGLPGVIQAELAWMAHWQAADGTRSSVLAISQLANILRRAIREGRPFPPSIRQMDWDAAAALQAWFYASRWGRFPPPGVRARLRVVFRFARTALIAACHGGHWWELDYSSALRPADSAVGTRTAGALRMLTRADHPSVAPGGGQVVPGHDAGVRRFALDHRQPGKTPVPAPV